MCRHCEERSDAAIRPFFPQRMPPDFRQVRGQNTQVDLSYSSAMALAAAMAFSWAAGGQSS